MSTRVPAQDLRGADLTLLEVTLPELVRRPISQLHLINVLDLVELADTDGVSKSLRRALSGFVDNLQRQISDLPRGRSFDEWLDELRGIDAERVPTRFREILAHEGEERDHEGVRDLLASWADTEPAPFVMGQVKTRVQRAEAVKPRRPAPEPTSAPREGRRKSSSRSSSSSGGSSTGRKISQPVEDIERQKFLEQIVLERLAAVSDKGLAEAVLLAGVKHRAKSTYDDVTPVQVKSALSNLKDSGRVRFSAGRWSAAGRW
jgi:hypothetical protein